VRQEDQKDSKVGGHCGIGVSMLFTSGKFLSFFTVHRKSELGKWGETAHTQRDFVKNILNLFVERCTGRVF
jgi:hypothetical protein